MWGLQGGAQSHEGGGGDIGYCDVLTLDAVCQLPPVINRSPTLRIVTESTRGPGWLSRYSESLLDGRSSDRTPAGARPVQNGAEALSASCTMSTGSSRGRGWGWGKRPERGIDHPLTPSAEVRNECNYTSTPPVCLPRQVTGRPLPLYHRHNKSRQLCVSLWQEIDIGS